MFSDGYNYNPDDLDMIEGSHHQDDDEDDYRITQPKTKQENSFLRRDYAPCISDTELLK